MCARNELVDLGFTSENFPPGTHMCLIFNGEDERKKVIGDFLKIGLKQGERVAYFADVMTTDEVKEWLSQKGVSVSANVEGGQLEITNATNTYCPGGEFVPDVMLDNLKNFYIKAEKDDYPKSRLSGEMSWALKNIPGSNRLMEYESRVNEVILDYPLTAICQYDADKFDGATIFECLKVHPYMIVRGQVVRNPYYLKPEEYLKTKVS